ncbi:S-adenosyl-L-methionine-dependent methyltransferase [Colletotrichum zoysiae]|uniref:rRNA adenine N(6)-methyltransferase n=1 Tax=Colletotrichum zoysiae TaxID=1216348 RepID=A0AAD9HC55_9PEZI|nr:S-adenosyl-L-methionine-dependent methyltransferase [Colletotrichum zoysiae]
MFALRRAWEKPLLTQRLLVRTAATRGKPPPKRLSKGVLQTKTPTAEKLAKTGLWYTPAELVAENRAAKKAPKGKAKEKTKRPLADKARVNIVSEELCDDILKYIGPTLERHRGCDLVDINPGAGVWSTKLHDFLQPRSHLLMEPDADLYQPFLEPLLQRPNTQLLPQSGLLWKELNEALANIENQTPRPRDPAAVPERNDTLLVTANISFYPKKRYRAFESVTQLILYQLISSIRTGTLFQRYGLVRMLVWTGPDEERSFLAKNVQGRKKSTLDAETACEWLAEVACRDMPLDTKGDTWFVRDRWIDVDSARNTEARMKASGITMPEGRKQQITKQLGEQAAAGKGPQAGVELPHLHRPYLAEIKELAQACSDGALDIKQQKRLSYLRHQSKRHEEHAANYLDLLKEMKAIAQLRQSIGEGDGDKAAVEAELAARDRAWNEKVGALGKNYHIDFRLIRDNLHLFQQDPPGLLWDRRPYEPLAVRADEFFPNVECTLLDIQPKAVHPLLLQMGPGTSRAGDYFEMLQRSMLETRAEPVSRSVERLWPGAAEGILPHCPSLHDPARGGSPATGHGELCSRVLSDKQWMELIEAFMAWPFRPSYHELIGRLADNDVENADDDSGASSAEVTLL